MAEGARLESVYTFARIEGSNPSLTARIQIQRSLNLIGLGFFIYNNFIFTSPISFILK